MKELRFILTWVGMILLWVAFIVIMPTACGGKVDGPTPSEDSFEVKGEHIVVSGKMKPGAKVTKHEAESVVKLAVEILEK